MPLRTVSSGTRPETPGAPPSALLALIFQLIGVGGTGETSSSVVALVTPRRPPWDPGACHPAWKSRPHAVMDHEIWGWS